jgi:hypothetical protein
MENTNALDAHKAWFLHMTKHNVLHHHHVTDLDNILVMNLTATNAELAQEDGSLLLTENHATDLHQSAHVLRSSTLIDGIARAAHQDSLPVQDTEDVFQLHIVMDTTSIMVMLIPATNATSANQDGFQALINTHVLNILQSVDVLKCSLKISVNV